jgi:hypothetical protein
MPPRIDIVQHITTRWGANFQLLGLQGDEPFYYQTCIQEAGKQLTEYLRARYAADPDKEPSDAIASDDPYGAALRVQVVAHDKCCGFHVGEPPILPPKDDTRDPMVALWAMMTDNFGSLVQVDPNARIEAAQLPWRPADDVVFILKDWDPALTEPDVIQVLRNIVSANLGATQTDPNDPEKVTRGQRMLVFLSSVAQPNPALPELHWTPVPLPDGAMLTRAVGKVIDGYGDAITAPDAEQEAVAAQLHGLTYQDAEDAVALAINTLGGWVSETIPTILEQAKASKFGDLPGISYVSRDDIAAIGDLCGYDDFDAYIRARMGVDKEVLAAHNMAGGFRGLVLAGAPGTGKTVAAMRAASLLGAPLLIWNLGESQGSLVSQSETQCRRVLEIANGCHALLLLDDIDKAGTNVAATGHTGDGGVFGRMIQMLLTEMSRKETTASFIFTMNRVANVPGELIRAGRVDMGGHFYAERPDEVTRLNILKSHAARRNFGDGEEGFEKKLALETEGWTGAELEGLIKAAAFEAMGRRAERLDAEWMCTQAARTVPMARQAIYKQDIDKMERDLQHWHRIGRVASTHTPPAATATRRARKATLTQGAAS